MSNKQDDSENKPAPKDGSQEDGSRSVIVKFLDSIEWLGNKLPDPAVLFLVGLVCVAVLSSILSNISFTETLPGKTDPIKIVNLLSLSQMANFLANMVETFVGFHPLGVVLVALLGVGVAEKSGFINACLKSMLNVTPRSLLTPMLILVAIVSHTAADAGYVLVIPIGGVMFYAAGRHPLAGIAAAFAGVSGGFSANFIPSGIDPLLSGLTQEGVDQLNPEHAVNPLCNYYFTAISSMLIIGVGWFLTDYIIEPRLKSTPIDGDPDEMPQMEELSESDKKGMRWGLVSIGIGALVLILWAFPANSALRDKLGKLDSYRNNVIDHGIELKGNGPIVLNASDAAAAAGLKPRDRIVQVGETEVDSVKSASSLLNRLEPGKPAAIQVERGEEKLTVEMVPAKNTVRAKHGVVLRNNKPVIKKVEAIADKAGLKIEDKILKIGDQEIDKVESAQKALDDLSPDKEVSIVVERGEEQVTLELVPLENDIEVDHGITLIEESIVSSVAGLSKSAGLAANDIINKVGKTEVDSVESTATALSELKADAPVIIQVTRDDEVIYLAMVPKTVPGAPMMRSIVPIIFFFFIIPGLVHGYVSGNFTNHREVVKGMSQTMETMGYYLVLVFFAALFIEACTDSNIGKLLALKGANFIKSAGFPPSVTIVCIIILSAAVNLLVGSASAKWALLAPIFVPMLMLLELSPELTQAAYRVGDSTTNIITPMMPYFPLVVVFCQRYVKNTGIGTVAAMMLPFSITFLITWTLFLLFYWQIGIPLGLDAAYEYVSPQ